MAINRLVSAPDVTDSTSFPMLTTRMVLEPTTIRVPTDFDTIQDAIDWIESRTILALVTLQVEDGTYTTTSGYNISHPNFKWVVIQGNTSTPANCVLNTGSGHVFTIYKSSAYTVRGFKFTGGGHGIYLNHGAILHECTNIEMQGLTYNGFHVVNGSSAPYCANINIHNVTQSGIYSYLESLVNIQNLTCQNNANYGVAVSTGSRVHLWGTTTVTGNSWGNYSATINSIQAPYGDLISVV